MDGLLSKAKARAARYCAFRERAPKEVLEKLQQWGLDEHDAEQVLQQLINENFVNEDRFARAFCHDKFEFNKWGKYKITQAISRFGLSRPCVETGLQAIDSTRYIQVTEDLAQKKWKSLTDPDPIKKRKKVLDYLMAKGFEQDLIREILRTLG